MLLLIWFPNLFEKQNTTLMAILIDSPGLLIELANLKLRQVSRTEFHLSRVKFSQLRLTLE